MASGAQSGGRWPVAHGPVAVAGGWAMAPGMLCFAVAKAGPVAAGDPWWVAGGPWPVAVGWWAGRRWAGGPVSRWAGGRWPLVAAGGRWPVVAGGRWQKKSIVRFKVTKEPS